MGRAAFPSEGLESRRLSPAWTDALRRVARYTVVRFIALGCTVVVGVYLSIVLANMGGKVDDIRRAMIREQVTMRVSFDSELSALPPEYRRDLIERLVRAEEERLGMDRPFLIRSLGYLRSALTLDLGRAEQLTSDSGSRQVRVILLERLAPTLLLFATAELFLFGFSIACALALSRNYGSALDRLIVALAPTSAAPSWLYGLILILVFSASLGWLPFGGMVDAPPPADPLAYALSVLKHLVLPVLSLVVSSVFFSIYSWRTFFLIYSGEDYVEMARAKGLPSGTIERRYILRPTLPTILTSFVLTLISMWMGSVLLETVFNWPGLGSLLFLAIGVYDTPVIVGSIVVYAYLLAISVFVLDIVYVLVDPRVTGTMESRVS